MRKNRVDVITLGCSKNLVDSEQLMRQFEAAGYTVFHDAPQVTGEIVVINTCGFIGDAKEESIEMILTCCQAKRDKQIKRLYVMGCLSQRYMQELAVEIPEVDAFYGKFDWSRLLVDLGKTYRAELRHERILTTPAHYAYLKISEGCNRTCSYCAIPLITGRYQSRPMEEILDEVRWLVSRGVKEFQVIAQDLTFYGIDRYKESRLAALVEAMAQIEGVAWIRLHYGYPAHFPMDLLPVMQRYDNVCKYIDIALQHSSDAMLAKMRRRVTRQETVALLEEIRAQVPEIHLRTTLMVGHPGETDEDFEDLLEFTRTQRFERMGAFTYSHEEGTYAATHYADDVPQEVKQERIDTLMRLQQAIASEINATKVGSIQQVIIDREDEEYYIGRTQYDSPEVDPEVLVEKSRQLAIGCFYQVRITHALPFELMGEVV